MEMNIDAWDRFLRFIWLSFSLWNNYANNADATFGDAAKIVYQVTDNGKNLGPGW
jgi:hypothetical protein